MAGFAGSLQIFCKYSHFLIFHVCKLRIARNSYFCRVSSSLACHPAFVGFLQTVSQTSIDLYVAFFVLLVSAVNHPALQRQPVCRLCFGHNILREIPVLSNSGM